MTERSQSLLLINHCSVFDLSFAKGAKRGGGGWPPLQNAAQEKKAGAGERGRSGDEAEKTAWWWWWWWKRFAEVQRRHHNTFLMKSEINQLHGLLDESGISQPLGGISCAASLARPDKDR